MSAVDNFLVLVTGLALIDMTGHAVTGWQQHSGTSVVSALVNAGIALWGLKLLGVFA